VNDGAAQSDVVAFLSQPSSYGRDVRSVERHETHGAIVFLAGERAYKLKRAVKFPYMDYSSIERREEMCRRELAINRRMAPELYLKVRAIIREDGALRFGCESESAGAVDWVVVMRRFPQEALLRSVCQSGGLTPQLMRSVAEAVAVFHAEAELSGDFGGEAGIRAVIEGNAAMLKHMVGRPFAAERVAQYEILARRVLAQVADLLESRRQNGFVRRCHGDLHLNNIFVDDGRPVLFDAIEFNDLFARIDVLYDLAFLLMDLDQQRLRAHANTVLNRYLETSGGHAGLAAVPLFLSCRAAVRAHTTVARAEARGDDGLRDQLFAEAKALLEGAIGYLSPSKPRLIAIGGVSGTGKSTLAYSLAPLLGVSPGAIVIRSDVIRRQRFGVDESVRLPQEAYTQATTTRVYDRMAEIASDVLASGYVAIADAVHGTDAEREQIAETARRCGAEFKGLWLEGQQELLEQRILARRSDASDATPDVLRAQLGSVTVPRAWSRLDVSATVSASLNEARRLLGC
jgi:aminoglycoside phosphotransferase family enzyme/predicted kinase